MVTILSKGYGLSQITINQISTVTSVQKQLEINVLGEREVWSPKTRSLRPQDEVSFLEVGGAEPEFKQTV